MKLFYTLLITCFTLSIGYSQNVKRPLITKRTATWCPNCGTWGWTFMKDIIDEVEGDALVLATHFSGDLQDQLNMDIASAFGGSGQPQFFLNGENIGANANNNADKLTEVRSNVSSINEETAELEIQLNAEYGYQTNGDYTLYAKVNVLPDTPLNDGTYTLGVYLVRDDINTNQSGQSGLVDHFKILSRNFTESSFGPEISGENGTGGEITFAMFHELDIDLERSEVAVIIWKDIDGQKEVVNTLRSEFTEIISSNEDLETIDVSAYQLSNGKIQIDSDVTILNVKLMDYAGRIISQQSSSDKQFTLDATGVLSGNYLISIQTEKATVSKKIFLR